VKEIIRNERVEIKGIYFKEGESYDTIEG
jgi:hypothetical protein